MNGDVTTCRHLRPYSAREHRVCTVFSPVMMMMMMMMMMRMWIMMIIDGFMVGLCINQLRSTPGAWMDR